MGDEVISVCHIPAKVASVRLAEKNIAPVNGRPALVWPVTAAVESGCFDEVVVTSDRPDVIEGFRHVLPSGVRVMEQRPSSILQTTRDVVEELGAWGGRVSIALATAVLLTEWDIRGAVEAAPEGPVMIVVRTHDPAWTMVEKGGELRRNRTMLFAEHGPWYVDAGEFYTYPAGAFRRAKTLYAKGLRGYLVPRTRAVDVDEAEDMELARVLFDYNYNGRGKRAAAFASS
jgi:N-acylneuraminate cytidylyltransferase